MPANSTYYVRKANGQCVYCGGIPIPGKTYCEICKEKSQERTKSQRSIFPMGESNREDNQDELPDPRMFVDYNAMIIAQNGRCVICGSSESGRKRFNLFSVDHDHKSGKIRDLLCHKCNLLVGWVENNQDLLPNVLEYLKRHK